MTEPLGPRTVPATVSGRLDQVLVETGIFESRAKAQEAIAAGSVLVDGSVASKASLRVSAGSGLRAAPAHPWVSRGGVKLTAALDLFGVDPMGRLCLDVGASTGGFTEVLLARGAAGVIAVDVGRAQLHPRIAAEPRVSDWSATDARDLTPARFDELPSLIVCDASFISLRLVLPPVLALAKAGADLVALIKPQFEVGPKGTKKGVVRDPALRDEACRSIRGLLETAGWTVLGLAPSPIVGGDGNIEFLIGARRF